MLAIKRTQTPFHLTHGSIDDHRKKREDVEKVKVRILVDKNVARYISSGKKANGFVSETIKKDKVEMIFMAPDIEHGFIRWYLMFADYATILEPESLKERLKEILKKATEKL